MQQFGLFTQIDERPQLEPVQISEHEYNKAQWAYVHGGSAYFRPWKWRGDLYGVSGMTSPGEQCEEKRDSLEAYPLLEVPTLAGIPQTLTDKWMRDGMQGSVCDDPLGAYHGVGVMHQGAAYVMVGRPRTFYKGPRLYSLVRSERPGAGKSVETVVASGLSHEVARSEQKRLEREWLAAHPGATSWTAVLYHLQLEV